MCFRRKNPDTNVEQRSINARAPVFEETRTPFSKPDQAFLSLVSTMGEHAQKGELRELEISAEQALTIAKCERWYRMQTIIYTVLGMSYLHKQKFSHAVNVFRKSSSAALLAKASGDPLGAKIELEALFAEASALFAGAQYREAADAYVSLVAHTVALGCPLHTMEAWMMAAYCQEIRGNLGVAATYNRMALDTAEKIPSRKRPREIIANIGESLLRLIDTAVELKRDQAMPERTEVCRRMERLLGPTWRRQCIPVDRFFGMTARFIKSDVE